MGCRWPAGSGCATCYRFSGVSHLQGAITVEVVPGNVHSPEKWRGCVVICVAGLAVVVGIVLKAKVRPAVGIRRSGGLVPAYGTAAKAATRPAAIVEPNRNPCAALAVVHNNRVADGIVEGTLPVSFGQARKGCATVSGHRCAGDVDGIKVAAA